jgi:6-phospho-beta-glucosidase
MKLSVIGASSVATLQLATALDVMLGELALVERIDISLWGRNEARLKGIAREVAVLVRAGADISSTTSLDDSLFEADIILIQPRIGGLEARDFDETFPHRVGLPGEETLGPGGFANALRTVPALDPVFSRIAATAPDALVVVLTNPAGIVRQAAASFGLNVVEVCEAPHALLGHVAERLNCRVSDLTTHYVGMNHVGFFVPEDEGDIEKLVDLVPISSDLVIAFGALPLSYLRYYVESEKQFEAQRGHPSRAKELIALNRIAQERLERGETPDLFARPAPWYSLAFVPVLRSLLDGARTPILLGTSNDGRLTGLPRDVTVEGAATVDKSGNVVTLEVPRVPPLALKLLEQHARYEHLALVACRNPNESNVSEALRANPMIGDGVPIDVLVSILLDAEARPAAMNLR